MSAPITLHAGIPPLSNAVPWKAASGHPGGWRVVRDACPMQELEGKNGRRILFKSFGSANARANKLNSHA